MGKVKECFVLKQSKTKIADLKRGDIFRVFYDEDGVEKYSDWQVALMDPGVNGEEVDLKSDTIHMVMGRPEVMDITLRKNTIDMKQESPRPVRGATKENTL